MKADPSRAIPVDVAFTAVRARHEKRMKGE
jgi:hypothetical protein